MRNNTKNTLRTLALGCAVASLGTAVSLYAAPVQPAQAATVRTAIDTVPTRDTMRPKPDTTMPTMPTHPDTTKPRRDTMPPSAAVKP